MFCIESKWEGVAKWKNFFLLWTNNTACTGVSGNFFWTEEKQKSQSLSSTAKDFWKVGLSLILNSIVKKNGITKNLEILLKSRFCYQICYKFHGKTKAMKGGES